eukprot:NODE_7_length_67686_cov_1.621421.p6 type:complete len:602 gc:universal NODE_7_length_67686_cov_1.621421:44836-46641(+)
MELFNEIKLNIEGVEVIQKKLVGYSMGVPCLMEPLLVAQYIKNENIIYKVQDSVEPFIERKEIIHDFIQIDRTFYFITELGLYKYLDGETTTIVEGNFRELQPEFALDIDKNKYDLQGTLLQKGTPKVYRNYKTVKDTSSNELYEEFLQLPQNIKELVQEFLHKEQSVKKWLDLSEFNPTESQKAEMSQMDYTVKKNSQIELNAQTSRIKEKQNQRFEALKEINTLKKQKPKRDHLQRNEKRQQLGVLDHIERYKGNKDLYFEIARQMESPKNQLILSLLAMDIDHFHTFANLNKSILKEYITIDFEVKVIAQHLEEAREDLKRVKAELRKKTEDNQDYLEQQKQIYNQIKAAYSDQIKIKEKVLQELNQQYEKYMNDIPLWSMNCLAWSDEIFSNNNEIGRKQFFIISQEEYLNMCNLLENQKVKHEDTRAQKFKLHRQFNVKQSDKQVVEKNIVQLKSDIANELYYKFGRELSLEEAENLIMSHKDEPVAPPEKMDPQILVVQNEIEKTRKEYNHLLLEQSELADEVFALNSKYISKIDVEPPTKYPTKSEVVSDIISAQQRNHDLEKNLNEILIDIEDLKVYPSRSKYYFDKWAPHDQ